MTSSTMYHPGLTFAVLVVQFATVKGALISSLEPRRGGGKPGGGGDTDPPTPSNNPGSTSAQSSTSLVSSTSQNATSAISSASTSTPSSSTSVSSITTSSGGSSSNSASPLPSPVIGVVRTNISTGGIVGAVIGSVIIGGVIFFLLAWCIRRTRKAPKNPLGRLPIAFLSRGPRAETPMTEMSQTQSNPLISSAVAAGATSNPFLSRYSRSFSPSTTTASLSPLNLSTSLHHTRSVASSSDRGTAHTRATSDLEILQTPNSSPLPIITAAANSASRSASESSGLHHAMATHQKALEEVDNKGREAAREEGNTEIEKIEGVNDPPPEYDV